MVDGRDRVLGSLEIASGRLVVAPERNVLGGISFRVVENEWSARSTGIEFDDELFAATLEELIFGAVFETSYQPLFRKLTLADTAFAPRSFEIAGDYLVIGVEGHPEDPAHDERTAATRTTSPHGSR